MMVVGFLAAAFCSFPIMFFSTRSNVISFLKILHSKDEIEKSEYMLFSPDRRDNIEKISSYIQFDDKEEDKALKKKKATNLFYLYTFGVLLFIAGVSLSVDNIAIVYNAIGAICSTSIGVLLPCLFYFELVRKKKKDKKLLYYVTIVLFIAIIPFGLFSMVAQYL